MSMSMLGFKAAAAAICSRSSGVSEWAGRFLSESRSFFSVAPALSAGAKVRLRVVIGVRALTICSAVSGSAAEAGPRPANNMAKAIIATAARHLDILRVFVICVSPSNEPILGVPAQRELKCPYGVAATPFQTLRPDFIILPRDRYSCGRSVG